MDFQRTYIEISDDYDHIDPNIEYILENVPGTVVDKNEEYRQLQIEFNSILLYGCEGDSCNHNCSNCLHGGNYKWDVKNQELILDTKKAGEIFNECSFICKCDPSVCLNRLIQKGPRKKLKIFDSDLFLSKGLLTTGNIPKGGFICEYAGEILTRNEASRRINLNEQNLGMNYILVMNEQREEGNSTNITIIDPSKKGNIGRYLNHSCDPNCEIRSVRVDCPIPKIAIFAKRDISAGEELCFHYNGGQIEKQPKFEGKTCLCGAVNCAGFMPFNNLLF